MFFQKVELAAIKSADGKSIKITGLAAVKATAVAKTVDIDLVTASGKSTIRLEVVNSKIDKIIKYLLLKELPTERRINLMDKTSNVSFANDIRPLFTSLDVDHMSPFFDLTSYEDVKNNAQNILQRLKGMGGAVMPPPLAKGGDGPWAVEKIALLQSWMDGGYQP